MTVTDEPAVLAWMIATAGERRPRAPRRRHWWRELVTDTYRAARDARDARDALRESGQPAPASIAGAAHSGAAYYQLSDAEFNAAHPPVRFADVLEHMAGGRWDPYGPGDF